MLYRAKTEVRTLAAATLSSTSGTSYSYRIPMQRRRLEGVILSLEFTQSATAPSYYDAKLGFLPIVKEIRVKVNDYLGQRNAVQITGPACIDFHRDQGSFIDYETSAGYAAASGASKYRLHYPVWLRHPAVEEPVGNILGIPLDQVNEDVLFEFDLDNTAAIATSGTNVPTAWQPVLTFIYREVPPDVKYIPTELITNRLAIISAGGRQRAEIAQGGFVSSISISGLTSYTGGTYVAGALLGLMKDGIIEVDYGPLALRRCNPFSQKALNDYCSHLSGPPSSSGHFSVDFLFDDTMGGAISPASCINVNPIPLGGDKLYVGGLLGYDSAGSGTAGVWLTTTHKFMLRDPNDLKALVGA